MIVIYSFSRSWRGLSRFTRCSPEWPIKYKGSCYHTKHVRKREKRDVLLVLVGPQYTLIPHSLSQALKSTPWSLPSLRFKQPRQLLVTSSAGRHVQISDLLKEPAAAVSPILFTFAVLPARSMWRRYCKKAQLGVVNPPPIRTL